MTEEEFNKLVAGISRVAYVKSISRKAPEGFHQFIINVNEYGASSSDIDTVDAELRRLCFECNKHLWLANVRSYYKEVYE